MCSDQYVRVRDGDSLLSELVGEYVGGTSKTNEAILSSNSKLLLEFFSNELSTIGDSCKGSFLTHAQQFGEYISALAMATRIWFLFLFFVMTSMN